MSIGWWNILNTQETVEREKPSSVAVLNTFKPVRLAPTTISRSKAFTCFVSHTQFTSQLSQGLQILPSPSTLIEVDLTSTSITDLSFYQLSLLWKKCS
jgi:hypothetical protein